MLYTDFIFKDFIWKFRRFFRFSRDNIQEFTLVNKDFKRKLTVYKKRKYFPYYTFDDPVYSKFMLSLMNLLEVRCFVKGELIANEMDESTEILFVESGIYEVGYEINKKLFFERQFGPSTVIGGF